MGIHPLSRIPAISLPLVVRCSHYTTRAPRLPRILPPITIQPTCAHLPSFCSFTPVFPYTSPIYSPGFSASLVEFFAGSLPLPNIYNIQEGPSSLVYRQSAKKLAPVRTERAVSLCLIFSLSSLIYLSRFSRTRTVFQRYAVSTCCMCYC